MSGDKIMYKITFDKEVRLKEIEIQMQLVRDVWARLEEEKFNLNRIKVIKKK